MFQIRISNASNFTLDGDHPSITDVRVSNGELVITFAGDASGSRRELTDVERVMFNYIQNRMGLTDSESEEWAAQAVFLAETHGPDRWIQAIKEFRKATGTKLVDAKNIIQAALDVVENEQAEQRGRQLTPFPVNHVQLETYVLNEVLSNVPNIFGDVLETATRMALAALLQEGLSREADIVKVLRGNSELGLSLPEAKKIVAAVKQAMLDYDGRFINHK